MRFGSGEFSTGVDIRAKCQGANGKGRNWTSAYPEGDPPQIRSPARHFKASVTARRQKSQGHDDDSGDGKKQRALRILRRAAVCAAGRVTGS